jgi:Cu(I)/Ag(I) efflux system membrane fusion protein
MTRAQKFRLVGLVVLKRVRFFAILAAVGMFIGYWDTVMNYWEKWTHVRSVAGRELDPGEEFYCPMDPQVVRSTYEPSGEVPKCPICGMPLSIRKKGEKEKLPEGITSRSQFSPWQIHLAGIKTVPVEYRPMARETKTVGYIAYDESRLSRVVSRVEGYVEKLYVDKTFTMVHQGDPLAEIYSPELYGTSKELLLSTRSGVATDLAGSARKRLQFFGVSAQEIDGILASGEPASRLVIRSPQTGYVVEKKIVVGSSVDAKMTLLEVADLSAVWVEAEVYEKDIPLLQVGQKVEATVEAYPNRTFTGKLALVYPKVETATRTNRVRFTLDNPAHELRPGMFATVRINAPLESIEPYKTLAAKGAADATKGAAEAAKGAAEAAHSRPLSPGERVRVRAAALERDNTGSDLQDTSPRPGPLPKGEGTDAPPQHEFLVVPERAVVDTGSKKVVYVELEPGKFEGREVELGPRQGDLYPVLKGLNPGEKVAAAGAFLIDAETRLNPAAASTYFGASGSPQSGSRPAGPSAPSQRQGEPTPSGPGKQDSGASQPRVTVATPNEDDLKNIAELPDEADRKLAIAQQICPVTEAALGSMGVPVKITLRGKPVFLCCKGCMGKAKRSPDEMLRKLADARTATSR